MPLYYYKILTEEINPIPTTFTSDTSVAGYVCSASRSDGSNLPWRVWKQYYTTSEWAWWSGSITVTESNPCWIQIQVPEAFVPYSISTWNEVSSPANYKTGIFQGSNDGTNWTNIVQLPENPNTAGYKNSANCNTNTAFSYFRLYFTESYTSSGISIQAIKITKNNYSSEGFASDEFNYPIEYYSAIDAGCDNSIYAYGTTPHNLTSNTSDPNYVISQSSDQDGTRKAFRAMDGSLDANSGCSHTGYESNPWWQIEFVNHAVIITKMIFTWRNYSDGDGLIAVLKASNNATDWVDILEFTPTKAYGAVSEYNITDEIEYKYWRIVKIGGGGHHLFIGEIEFDYKYRIR